MAHLTIYEIAEKAKVSIATVSRAINPETRAKVAPDTLREIEEIIKKCGYTPNVAAKHLGKTRFQTIGVLIPQHQGILLENYYTQVLAGISDGLMESDYHMRLVMLKCSGSKYDKYNFKVGQGIDGMIVTHWHAFFSSKTAFEKLGIPCVVLSDPEKNVRAHFISGDHKEGGRLAAEHLYGLGHRKFGILTGPADSIDSRLRVEGFTQFLETKGIRVKPEHMACGEFQEEKGRDAAGQIFASKPGLTALFCCNDQMAFGAVRKLWDLGLACPKDVSVVGYDDDKMAAAFEPPLTTLHVPLYEMAAQASRKLVSFLGGEIKKDEFHAESLVPVRLIVRKSAAQAR